MTKKDLFDGLNHIDEKIIEEAAEPVRIRKKSHKKLKKNGNINRIYCGNSYCCGLGNRSGEAWKSCK